MSRDAWHAEGCGGWPACNGCGWIDADLCWWPGPCPEADRPHQTTRPERGEVYDALDGWEPADQPTGEQIEAILAAHDSRRGRSVLVVGNPDGFEIIGPVHADDPDMLRHAEDHGGDWWLLPLTPLAEALAGAVPP